MLAAGLLAIRVQRLCCTICWTTTEAQWQGGLTLSVAPPDRQIKTTSRCICLFVLGCFGLHCSALHQPDLWFGQVWLASLLLCFSFSPCMFYKCAVLRLRIVPAFWSLKSQEVLRDPTQGITILIAFSRYATMLSYLGLANTNQCEMNCKWF